MFDTNYIILKKFGFFLMKDFFFKINFPKSTGIYCAFKYYLSIQSNHYNIHTLNVS